MSVAPFDCSDPTNQLPLQIYRTSTSPLRFSLKPLTVTTGEYGDSLYEWTGSEPSDVDDTFSFMNSFAIHPTTLVIYGQVSTPAKTDRHYLIRTDTTGLSLIHI